MSGSSKIQTLLPCDKLEKNGVKDDAIISMMSSFFILIDRMKSFPRVTVEVIFVITALFK